MDHLPLKRAIVIPVPVVFLANLHEYNIAVHWSANVHSYQYGPYADNLEILFYLTGKRLLRYP
jgi:hypothetical protein